MRLKYKINKINIISVKNKQKEVIIFLIFFYLFRRNMNEIIAYKKI